MTDPFLYCEKIARGHYENFPVGWFVPREKKRYLYTLYAFARTADDFADEETSNRLEKLEEWGERLRAAAKGQADHPLFEAMVRLFRETSVPPSLCEDLLVAFRWDVTKRRYQSYAELLEYCRYSANPIGRAVLHLFGLGEERRLTESDKICTGIQLVNHWQDIAVDWRKGRVYLPQEDLRRFGVPENEIEKGRVTDRWRSLLRFEIRRTRSLFYEGRPLLEGLPARLRWQVQLMWGGPLRILEKIEAVDFDVFQGRPTLTKKELIALFFRNRIGRA